MHIKIINPNTTWRMTEKIGACARAVARPGTRIEAVNPPMGPASIESHYDEALAVPGLLHEIALGEQEGASGYVIACFGDPGLKAARELASVPVVGIAEAAMHLASLVATRFSVVTTLQRTVGQAWHLAEAYGMKRFCANVRACDIPVLALEEPGSAARNRIVEECRRALEEDGSDAIVLGCAGMADLCADIGQALGVPVIDGVAAGIQLVESLVNLRLATSKRGELARPLPKPIAGLLGSFSLAPAGMDRSSH
ncbi:aspartate/glutamate racemase family protein [Variovorax sp. J22P168]|uniref:aspartate/glutamate racemase family protein n=1 Tax=Variovorax jilinensis TaxID=3053513 RepID=UPI0025749703|nr:aspartate/glutamate racemase family protein [Variovorax sp. J22P168]MDM0011580.1 aspartate/glutamate racemase family protein [Variovorax sp. J22P168]